MAQNPRVRVRYVVDDDQSKWIAIKSYWHLDNTEFLLSKDSNRVFQDAGSVSRTGDKLRDSLI
jgi:hypothetical protein